jgi:hypothetical protein
MLYNQCIGDICAIAPLATARLYRVVDNDNSEEKGILYILLI